MQRGHRAPRAARDSADRGARESSASGADQGGHEGAARGLAAHADHPGDAQPAGDQRAAATTFPTVAIIGGPAIPAIEGWILALLGVRDTERMSRERANAEREQHDRGGKRVEDYCDVIAKATLDPLPPGSDALRAWIETADEILARAIRGSARP